MIKERKLIKKALVFFVCFSMIFCSIPLVNAESIEDLSNISLSESKISELKKQFDVSTENGKKEYIDSVLELLGVNDISSEMMTEKMIENFVSAEEFGYIKNPDTSEKTNPRSLGGGDVREYDDITLSILWGKTDDKYSILGSCVWTDMPTLRYTDVISIDLGGGAIKNDSQELVVRYTKNNTSYEESYSNDDNNYCGVGTACTFEYDLKVGMRDLSFVIGYEVTKSSNENTLCLQYFHKFLPANISISLSSIVGIAVAPALACTEYNLQCGTAEEG